MNLDEVIRDDVSTGDELEYSLSVEIRSPSGATWIKVGLKSQVRAGESEQDAVERVYGYVERTAIKKIDELRNGEI